MIKSAVLSSIWRLGNIFSKCDDLNTHLE